MTDPARPDPLLEISRRAWQTNRGRADQLVQLVTDLRADLRAKGTVSQHQHELARSVTHQMVGSAGTFGHEQVSESARRIEVLLVELPSLDTDGIAELERLVQGVRDGLEQEPSLDL